MLQPLASRLDLGNHRPSVNPLLWDRHLALDNLVPWVKVPRLESPQRLGNLHSENRHSGNPALDSLLLASRQRQEQGQDHSVSQVPHLRLVRYRVKIRGKAAGLLRLLEQRLLPRLHKLLVANSLRHLLDLVKLRQQHKRQQRLLDDLSRRHRPSDSLRHRQLLLANPLQPRAHSELRLNRQLRHLSINLLAVLVKQLKRLQQPQHLNRSQTMVLPQRSKLMIQMS